MTTLRQITTKALRESGLIQLGTNPDNDEYSEAVDKLKLLISTLPGAEMGESLTTIIFGSSGVTRTIGEIDYAPEIRSSCIPSNFRVLFNHSSAETLYLRPNPQDGARIGIVGDFGTNNVILNANGRSIEGAASVTLSTNDLSREWFYRADLGGWQRVTSLDDDDELPYPAEYDDLFITLLAARVSPQYGIDLAQGTLTFYNRSLKKFKNQYTQKKETASELGLLFLTNTCNRYSNEDFITGRS